MNPALIHHCNAMVQHAIANGGKPVVFLMSETTKSAIAETLLHVERQRRSAFSRFWHWLRGEKFELTHLMGVPVIVNLHLPDGYVSLQVAQERADSGQEPGASLTQANLGAAGALDGQESSGNPFMRRERVEPEEDKIPTLAELSSSGNGSISPSDVLMKAMTDVDDLAGIVVVRVHRNQDVDLCMSCNSFEAQGVLNRAQMWLAMRGQ